MHIADRRSIWLLAGVLALAAALRLHFFVGLASGDPQDDGVYYRLALDMAQHGLAYLRPYAHLPADFVANPIDQFPFRPLAVLPTALLFRTVGPSEPAAVAWPLFCSLATALLVYRIGSLVVGRETGLIAAALCAVYPLEVINASRILADAPLEFFCAVSLWLWLEGRARGRRLLFVLAGMAAGCGYLTKPPALAFFAFLFAATLFDGIRSGRWAGPLLLLTGLLAVLGLEAGFYARVTGDPLMTVHIHMGAERFKYQHEGFGTVGGGVFTVLFNNGAPLDLTRAAFGLQSDSPDHFGIFAYLFAAALVYAGSTRRAWPLGLLGLATFVYFEWGPAAIVFDRTRHTVQYFMLPKQGRFLMMATPALVVVAAMLIDELRHRSAVAATLVLAVLGASSLRTASHASAHYRAGLQDLRSASHFILDASDLTFHGDLWMVEHVKIFSRYRATNLAVLTRESTPDELKGGCLVVGGSRGVELVSEYVESTLPDFVRQIAAADSLPPGARLVARVAGPRSAFRTSDLRIYCFPRS